MVTQNSDNMLLGPGDICNSSSQVSWSFSFSHSHIKNTNESMAIKENYYKKQNASRSLIDFVNSEVIFLYKSYEL